MTYTSPSVAESTRASASPALRTLAIGISRTSSNAVRRSTSGPASTAPTKAYTPMRTRRGPRSFVHRVRWFSRFNAPRM